MIKLEGAEEKVEAARPFSLLDKTLFERRTLTLFGEIDMDVAQRTAEKLLALAYTSDDPAGLLSGRACAEDLEPEIVSLRPRRLADYVGQADVVETLKIAIEAASQRGEPIDHVLLHGPPGLGKTTLAHIVAKPTKSFH